MNFLPRHYKTGSQQELFYIGSGGLFFFLVFSISTLLSMFIIYELNTIFVFLPPTDEYLLLSGVLQVLHSSLQDS